jgi:hypothetical protein
MRYTTWCRSFTFWIGLCFLVLLTLGTSFTLSKAARQSAPTISGFSLQFYGNGYGDLDRVKIQVDGPARPVDIGAVDFTIEFWMKASLANNPNNASCNANDGWITGNIILDRDIYGEGDYGDFGISLSQGKIAFGVSLGSSGTTLCGATTVANDAWHHIALTRNQSNGQLRIYVDGQLDGQGSGPVGNISYRDNRTTSFNDDPFLVIGAEKHDAGGQYPSYSGWVDELRLSNSIRYTSVFTAPSLPFVTDSNTVGLYHFDEGPLGNCTGKVLDSSGASGGPSNGVCMWGGSPDGPDYTNDIPFAADATTPTGTGSPASTTTPTSTPNSTLAPTNTPNSTAAPTNSPTQTSTQAAASSGDDFNRVNSTNLGATWTERSGDMSIFSQTLRNAGTSSDNIVTFNTSALINVQTTVSMSFNSPAGTMATGVRLGTYTSGIPTAGYVAELSGSGQVILWRIDNWATLGSYQIPGYQYSQPVLVALRALGTTLSVDINGVTRINVTNSAFSSGNVGLWAYAPSIANQFIFDNYSLVDLTQLTPTPAATFTATPTTTSGSSPVNTPTATAINTPIPTLIPAATNTPTITPTPLPQGDLIFSNGFESGNLSAWSLSMTDYGDLSVSTAAVLSGNFGLRALIDSNGSIYVVDNTPNSLPSYRARFHFDPNTITMSNGNSHYILYGYSGSLIVVRIEFLRSNGYYLLRVHILADGNSWRTTNWIYITDAPHAVEISWLASSAVGANNGSLTLWLDGMQRSNLSGIDNDTHRIDSARLGALDGIDYGTRGTYYFDTFESRRVSYIGP